jgi:hypothetical protein
MDGEKHEVGVDIPDSLGLTDEEKKALKENFKAHVVETVQKKGEAEPPTVQIINGT